MKYYMRQAKKKYYSKTSLKKFNKIKIFKTAYNIRLYPK